LDQFAKGIDETVDGVSGKALRVGEPLDGIKGPVEQGVPVDEIDGFFVHFSLPVRRKTVKMALILYFIRKRGQPRRFRRHPQGSRILLTNGSGMI
jgi:hypothetical protein